MRIIFRDDKEGSVKLSIDNLDDLWHIYNIVKPGDLVYGVSFRSLEKSSDMIRSKKSEKVKVYLGIRVENLEFQKFSDRLRIHGIIVSGDEGLNSYHTLNYTMNDTIKIVKERWNRIVIDRIEHAVKESKKPILIITSVDDESATIAYLRSYGIQIMGEIKSGHSGKMYKEKKRDIMGEFFGNITSMISSLWHEGVSVVIIGPGFTASELVNKIRQENMPFSSMTVYEASAHSGKVGIYEAIKRGIIKKIDVDNRLSLEIEVVEKFMEMLAKNKNVAYGSDEVKRASEMGAVDILLVTDRIIWNEDVQYLMKNCEKEKSTVMVISTEHESGRMIENLGGIAAILRYEIY